MKPKPNYRQIYAIKAENKRRILAVCPDMDNASGIYVFTREDENGFKYAYVGQAVNLLERAADHLSGYLRIDLSIKKHGLYDPIKKPYGWNIGEIHKCSIETLNDEEQRVIRRYAFAGYQMRNETTGSQGEDKKALGDHERKGYLLGKHEGAAKATAEIGALIAKYTTGLTSKGGAVADRKTAELLERLKEV